MGPPPPSGRRRPPRPAGTLVAALAAAALTLLSAAGAAVLPLAAAAGAQSGGTSPSTAAPTTPTSTAPGADGDTPVDGAGSASAADPLVATVSPALAARGWFTEAGGGAESRTLERLSRRLHADGNAWGLVALREPPQGGTRFFAEDVLDDLRAARSDISTVVVLTPEDIAADSRTYAAGALDEAVTAAIPDFQHDVTAGYERLFQLLAGAPLTHELAPLDASSDTAPQPSTVPLFVAGGALLVVAAAVLAGIGSRRAGRD